MMTMGRCLVNSYGEAVSWILKKTEVLPAQGKNSTATAQNRGILETEITYNWNLSVLYQKFAKFLSAVLKFLVFLD